MSQSTHLLKHISIKSILQHQWLYHSVNNVSAKKSDIIINLAISLCGHVIDNESTESNLTCSVNKTWVHITEISQ